MQLKDFVLLLNILKYQKKKKRIVLFLRKKILKFFCGSPYTNVGNKGCMCHVPNTLLICPVIIMILATLVSPFLQNSCLFLKKKTTKKNELKIHDTNAGGTDTAVRSSYISPPPCSSSSV